MLKYFKIGRYGLAALVSIFCSATLRLVLLAQGWPVTNSDEATMGLMARDIAYRGRLPIFFYGQNYMGAFEAYVAAVALQLFGSSLFSLRVGLVLLFLLFLLSTYLLTSLLYSKGWALIVVTMLGLGSSFVLTRELSAIGGYPETLLFGSLAFLLAARLALGYEPAPSKQRHIGYICWGLVVGLGLWSDLLIAPFALCSGLLLLVCCWQEIRGVIVGLCALLGLVVGGFPLLLYNLTAAPGQDSLSVLWQIQHSGNGYIAAHAVQQIFGTLQVSIPMITGSPFCPVPERLESAAMTSLPCTLARASWGTVYLLIFIVALLLAVRAMLRSYRQSHKSPMSQAARQAFMGDSARLLLLASALITLLLYAMGGSPVEWPGSRSRYLIGLLIATPAILWPLWYGWRHDSSTIKTHIMTWLHKWLSISVLLLAIIFLLLGTILTFAELPATQKADQQQQALIDHLIQIGATHIYSDYWTCNRLAFVSNERVICGVVEQDLQRSANFNRDPAYYPIVSADAHACYVFSIHTHIFPQIQQTRLAPEKYKRTLFDTYIIYQPLT